MDVILKSIDSRIKECEISKYSKSELEKLERDIQNMALGFIGLKMHDESLTCLLRYLDIQRKLSKEQDIASTLLWIGKSYKYLDKYDEAIKYYNESLQICYQYPETKWRVIDGIAKCLFHQRKFDEALNKFKESYEIISIKNKFNLFAQNETDRSNILYNIGRVYEKKEMYVEALDYFSKSLEIYQRVFPLGHKQLRALFYYIGKMHYKLEDCETALSYLKLALDEFGNSEVDCLIDDIKNTIGLAYKKLGNFQEAFKYLNDEKEKDCESEMEKKHEYLESLESHPKKENEEKVEVKVNEDEIEEKENGEKVEMKEIEEKIEEDDEFLLVNAINEIDID